MVQTCTKGLQKIYLTKNKDDWDLALPYITMGYRMSKHTSLSHFSPCFLLFGKHPIPPSSVMTLAQVARESKSTTWSIWATMFYSEGLCPWPWRICPLHSIETPYDMHTHEVTVTNLRWDNLMLVTLCISSGNLMIL